MDELISVIIPVYGVEKYINRFLDSVLNQTYRNLEIILVDDESPDKSGLICDEYAKRDCRIKVIHQKNTGAAGARNTGLEVSNGQYIGFLDPDDYIAPTMFEQLYNTMIEEKSDIVVCDYLPFQEGENLEISEENYKQTEISTIVSERERLQYMFLEKYVDSIIFWNKLYKKELWMNEKIPQIRAYEDEAIIYKILDKANKITYVHQKLYFYMLRKRGSITTQDFSEKRLVRLDVLGDRIEYYILANKKKYFVEMLFVYKTDLLKIFELIEKSGDYSDRILDSYLKKYRKYCFSYLIRYDKNVKNVLTHLWFACMPRKYYRRYKKQHS